MIGLLLASQAFAVDGIEVGGGGGTAHTLGESGGTFAAGVFRPWTFAVSERTDLITTGLVGTFLSPRLDVKHAVVRNDGLSVAFEAGFAIPSPALALAQGWLYAASEPTPFAFIGKAGARVTGDLDRVPLRITGTALLRGGFATAELTPRDFFFVDWALAPAAEGPFLFVMGGQVDWVPSTRVQVSFSATTQFGGEGRGFELQNRLFGLWGFSEHMALGVGAFSHLDERPDGYRFYFIPTGDFQVRF
jgi:hypothetical protein